MKKLNREDLLKLEDGIEGFLIELKGLNKEMDKDLAKLRREQEKNIQMQKISNYLMIMLLITGIIYFIVSIIATIKQ